MSVKQKVEQLTKIHSGNEHLDRVQEHYRAVINPALEAVQALQKQVAALQAQLSGSK